MKYTNYTKREYNNISSTKIIIPLSDKKNK